MPKKMIYMNPDSTMPSTTSSTTVNANGRVYDADKNTMSGWMNTYGSQTVAEVYRMEFGEAPKQNVEIKNLLVQLISHQSGFSAELFGLCIYRNKKGHYICNHAEFTFETPEEVVDFFLSKQQELRLGLEYQDF